MKYFNKLNTTCVEFVMILVVGTQDNPASQIKGAI